MSQLLRDATNEYRIAFGGEGVWCPYVLNNRPCLPNPRIDVLSRPGAGKITAVEFKKAAQYAYEQVMIEGVSYSLTVPEAVRTRLVDGSLPDDTYNYTGVDCSGFATQVLQHAFEENGRDFFGELRVSYDNVVKGYAMPGWTPNLDERAVVLERARENGGLSAREFTRIFRKHGQPASSVNIARLVSDAVKVEGDLQPGDLAVYTPTDPLVIPHVAIILDTDRNSVNFAHSGRIDPAIERGGVEIFTFPRKSVFDREFKHGHRGTMAIHRLNALASI